MVAIINYTQLYEYFILINYLFQLIIIKEKLVRT